MVRDPPELKHAPVYRYQRFVRPFLARGGDETPFATVAVVREPISWLGSWYRYRSRPALEGHPNSTAAVSFDDFVTEYTRGNRKADYAKVGSQARFLKDKDGAMGVDHLFRYEEMERLLSFLSARLGSLPELPRLNVSPERALSLSKSVEERLRDRCAAEFDAWEAAGRADQ